MEPYCPALFAKALKGQNINALLAGAAAAVPVEKGEKKDKKDKKEKGEKPAKGDGKKSTSSV